MSFLVSLGVYLATSYGVFIRTQLHTFNSTLPTNTPTTTIPAVSVQHVNITSIEFNVTDTDPSKAVVFGAKWSYYVKNIGTPYLEVRAEYLTPSGLYITIINGEQRNAWIYKNGQWGQFPSHLINYDNIYQAPIGPIQNYTNAIAANWTGSGNYIYAYDTSKSTAKVTLSDIVINPALPESLFQPNT